MEGTFPGFRWRQVAGDVDEAGEGSSRVLPPLPVLVGLAVLGQVGLLDVGAELMAQVLVEERDVDQPRLGVERVDRESQRQDCQNESQTANVGGIHLCRYGSETRGGGINREGTRNAHVGG